jgi:hypothetical protein
MVTLIAQNSLVSDSLGFLRGVGRAPSFRFSTAAKPAGEPLVPNGFNRWVLPGLYSVVTIGTLAVGLLVSKIWYFYRADRATPHASQIAQLMHRSIYVEGGILELDRHCEKTIGW